MSGEQKDVVRRLICAGRELRTTVRPDADLVDAMCATDDYAPLDRRHGQRFAAVAQRAFNRYVKVTA
jgi:hypothetical protein